MSAEKQQCCDTRGCTVWEYSEGPLSYRHGNHPNTMPSSLGSTDDSDELSSTISSSFSEDEEYRIAQREWEESLQQLQQLVAIVLLPFFGRWLGRRFSQIAYARYLRLGLNKAFFFGEKWMV